jgi:hypothetical protein
MNYDEVNFLPMKFAKFIDLSTRNDLKYIDGYDLVQIFFKEKTKMVKN